MSDNIENTANIETTRKSHKKDWDDNHELITNTIIEIINESKGKKMPTYQKIADRTGLHYETVLNHCKEIEFKPLESPLRSLTPYVCSNIFNLSKKNAAAQKLWLQVMEGWTENNSLKITGQLDINTFVPQNENQLKSGLEFIKSITNENTDTAT